MERLSWLSRSAILATMLLLSGRSAVAQPAQNPALGLLTTQAPETVEAAAYIFVHPVRGSDRATGDQAAPVQTITHALSLAAPGTTVMLSPGRYSRGTGERFPLRISEGVTLEGDVAAYGDGVVIIGGGDFASSIAGRQNAAAIASGTAMVRGITLSNPEGHGLWVESGAVVVSQCLFWGSRQDGIAVGGNSRPRIRHNRFYQNRGNGIAVRGTAAPLIQTNRIENTGYGVAIQDEATPRLLQNYISDNRSGVVVQGRSRPILRQNHITRNRQDGVVVIAQGQPDLGIQGQPGNNRFSSNGQYAINAQASDQIIAAAGNALLTGSPAARLAGRIDTRGLVSLGSADVPGNVRRLTPSEQPASPLLPSLPVGSTAGSNTADAAVPIPVIPPAQTQGIPNQPAPLPTVAGTAAMTQRPAVNSAANSAGEMAIVPIAATQRSVSPQRSAAPPPRNRNLLPVPSSRAPLGHVGGRSTVSAAAGGSQRPASRYRVLVEARSPREQALTRAIAPGAFLTRINGSAVMQAGAYQRRENATQMQRQLANSGLRVQVQHIR